MEVMTKKRPRNTLALLRLKNKIFAPNKMLWIAAHINIAVVIAPQQLFSCAQNKNIIARIKGYVNL